MFFFLQLPFILGYAVYEIFANPQEFFSTIIEEPEVISGSIAAIGSVVVLLAESLIQTLVG